MRLYINRITHYIFMTDKPMAKKILIVDDEPDILEILRFNMEVEGYEVMTSLQPMPISAEFFPDLIIADVMMEPISGFEWARELKSDERTMEIPIIFCTAKTTENDLLTGFGLGSDDYICKPFRVSEVKARVKAVLRRSPVHNPIGNVTELRKDIANTLEYEGLFLDLDRKECKVDGNDVAFTKLEFELLALLLNKPGQVFSREKILQAVWPDDTIVLDRTVDVNITRIRKKIGRYGENIKTKFGYGYSFNI